jgi:PRC-barrel domain protein
MTTLTDAYTWKDRTVIGADGEKLGRISEIYEDGQTGRPE